MKFKVGQRVVVFGGLHNTMGSPCLDGHKGTVENCPVQDGTFPNNIWVEFDTPIQYGDGEDKAAWVHPKQCRPLKKKVYKRIWLEKEALTGDFYEIGNNRLKPVVSKVAIPGWVEFKEVRQRKPKP